MTDCFNLFHINNVHYENELKAGDKVTYIYEVCDCRAMDVRTAGFLIGLIILYKAYTSSMILYSYSYTNQLAPLIL